MESKSSRLRDEQQERHRHVLCTCTSFEMHCMRNESEVNAWVCAPATDRDLESGLRKSMSVGTRKMVNHA